MLKYMMLHYGLYMHGWSPLWHHGSKSASEKYRRTNTKPLFVLGCRWSLSTRLNWTTGRETLQSVGTEKGSTDTHKGNQQVDCQYSNYETKFNLWYQFIAVCYGIRPFDNFALTQDWIILHRLHAQGIL